MVAFYSNLLLRMLGIPWTAAFGWLVERGVSQKHVVISMCISARLQMSTLRDSPEPLCRKNVVCVLARFQEAQPNTFNEGGFLGEDQRERDWKAN